MTETNRRVASRRSRSENSWKGKGAAIEKAVAQWIAERDR